MAERRDNLEGQILPLHSSDRALQAVRRPLNEPVCFPSFSPKALHSACFVWGFWRAFSEMIRSAEFLHVIKEIAYLLQEIIWESQPTSCFKSLYSTCTLWNHAWWSGRPCEAPDVCWDLKFINSRLCPNIPLFRKGVHIPLSPSVPLHTFGRYYTKSINSRVLTHFTFSFVFRCSLSEEFCTFNPSRQKVHPFYPISSQKIQVIC